MKKKLVGLLAVLLSFAMIAAACGGDDDSSSSASSSSTEGLNIGTLLPETGPLAFLSQPMLQGVNMAIRDINAAGGVNGADVTLTPGDSGTDAEIANTTVDRLITENVDAIIGAASSGTTGSVIDKITKTNGITQCSPSNTASGLGTSGDDGYYFRTAPSDDLQAPLLAEVVLADGYTNVAVVSRADDYGVGFNAVLEPAIEAGGGTIVYNTPYAPEATSFDDVVQDVVASGPDAVVLVAFEEGFQIIQAMIEQGAGPDAIQIYITDGMATGELGAAIDPNNPGIAEGMKGTAPAAAPSSGAAFFPAAFAEFAPDVPSIYSSQSYDCAILIALAAEAAGSNDSADIAAAMVDVSRDGEKCTTFADCKDLLAGGTNIDYDGASGAIDFLDVGEPGAGIYDVYDFDENGVQRVLEQQTFTSGSTPEADPVAAGIARAQAVVDSFSEPPDQITVTESIDSVVPEGKTVAWLACEVTCAAFNPAFEAATEALNWNLEILNIASFGANSSILTALDLGADFIAITGTPPATIADEIETMVDAGVGLYSCFDTTLPSDLEGLMTNCSGNDNVFAAGSVHANNVIVRSNGTAKVLMVNIPDFAVLVSQRNGAAAAFEENCPNCTFEELAVSLDQLLTGEVPGAIISAFQADPDLNWLMVAFDGMLYGILDALEGADLDERISVSLTDHDAASLQECVDGRIEFGTVNPVLYTAWLMVDGMVRTSVGQDIPGNGHVTPPIPLFLTQTPESCQALLDTPEADWKGPATMEAQFSALWGRG